MPDTTPAPTPTICYKLVSVASEGRLYSAFTRHPDYRTAYSTDHESISPTSTGLFVFDSAQSFKEEFGVLCSSERLYRAECFDELPLPVHTYINEDGSLVEYWDESWPTGTRLFRRVRLLDEVDMSSHDR